MVNMGVSTAKACSTSMRCSAHRINANHSLFLLDLLTNLPLYSTMPSNNPAEMTASIKTMPESLIGRLPQELRNKV